MRFSFLFLSLVTAIRLPYSPLNLATNKLMADHEVEWNDILVMGRNCPIGKGIVLTHFQKTVSK